MPRRSQSLNLKLNEELLGSGTLWFSFDLLPNLSVLKWSRWSVFTRLGSNIPWILTVLLLLLLIYGANNNCIYRFMSLLLTILHSVVKLSTGSLWVICLGLLCYLNLKLSLCALNNSLQITVFLDSVNTAQSKRLLNNTQILHIKLQCWNNMVLYCSSFFPFFCVTELKISKGRLHIQQLHLKCLFLISYQQPSEG